MADRKSTPLPLEISPLIKLARWTFLIAGIIYGFNKRREYSVLETTFRKREAKKRAMREEYLAREKPHRDAAELEELEKMILGTSASSDESSKETNENLDDDKSTFNEETSEILISQTEPQFDENEIAP